MYKAPSYKSTTLEINASYVGESIEDKIRRVMQSGEPINETAPLIYTERKDGVLPQYDIKTDRFEIAQEAHGKIDKTYKAQRDERLKAKEDLGKQAKDGMTKEQKSEKTSGNTDNSSGGTTE